MRMHRAKPGRANAQTWLSHKTATALKGELYKQRGFTREGRMYYLGIRQCGCGRLHYGQRDRHCIGKQKEIARLCPSCFELRYGKRRPKQFRFLTEEEIMGYYNEYKAQGCRVYKVDPSTL